MLFDRECSERVRPIKAGRSRGASQADIWQKVFWAEGRASAKAPRPVLEKGPGGQHGWYAVS